MSTLLLCILDGLGLNPNSNGNAVAQANKPTLDRLFKTCPNATLITHGEVIGLPAGQMGNSEVGHLHIGAGRTVDQSLIAIKKAFEQNLIDTNDNYKKFVQKLAHCKDLHLVGLYSAGGVHSHKDHLLLLLEKLSKYKIKIYLHIILDGRDTAPNSGLKEVQELEQILKNYPNCYIASVSGRYFAMDRDTRFERTAKAFNVMINQSSILDPASKYIQKSYQAGISDEFVVPMGFNTPGISQDSALVFWNFRADRMRQIVKALALKNFSDFDRLNYSIPNNIICFMKYSADYNLPVLFEKAKITNSLGEYLANLNKTQLRIAETEKYPHVTYFFNGGREANYKNEERILVPSPREVKTYDLKPEMSAYEVTKKTVEAILSKKFDFIVLNYANCDMVGHTGVLAAAIKAVETVDTCLGEVLNALDQVSGQALIIADHGNAEQMINYEDNTPHTAHTKFPVPMIAYNSNFNKLTNGSLIDVAPTILTMMDLEVPIEMKGVCRSASF